MSYRLTLPSLSPLPCVSDQPHRLLVCNQHSYLNCRLKRLFARSSHMLVARMQNFPANSLPDCLYLTLPVHDLILLRRPGKPCCLLYLTTILPDPLCHCFGNKTRFYFNHHVTPGSHSETRQ